MASCSDVKNDFLSGSVSIQQPVALLDNEGVLSAAKNALEQLVVPRAPRSLEGRLHREAEPVESKISLKTVVGLDAFEDISLQVMFKRWQLKDLSLLNLLGLDLYDKIQRLPAENVAQKENKEFFLQYFCEIFSIIHSCMNTSPNYGEAGEAQQGMRNGVALLPFESLLKSDVWREFPQKGLRQAFTLFCKIVKCDMNYYSRHKECFLLDKKIDCFVYGDSLSSPCVENTQKSYEHFRTYMSYCGSLLDCFYTSEIPGLWSNPCEKVELLLEDEREVASLADKNILEIAVQLRGNLLKTTRKISAILDCELPLEVKALGAAEIISVRNLIAVAASTFESRIATLRFRGYCPLHIHMESFITTINGYTNCPPEQSSNTLPRPCLAERLQLALWTPKGCPSGLYSTLFECLSKDSIAEMLPALDAKKSYEELLFWFENLLPVIRSARIDAPHHLIFLRVAENFSELSKKILLEEPFITYSEIQVEELIAVIKTLWAAKVRYMNDSMTLQEDLSAIMQGKCIIRNHPSYSLEPLYVWIRDKMPRSSEVLDSKPLEPSPQVAAVAQDPEELELPSQAAAVVCPVVTQDLVQLEETEEKEREMPPIQRKSIAPRIVAARPVPEAAAEKRIPFCRKRGKLIKDLTKAGYFLARQRGPHMVFKNAKGHSIPVPKHGELKTGTAQSIMKAIQE